MYLISSWTQRAFPFLFVVFCSFLSFARSVVAWSPRSDEQNISGIFCSSGLLYFLEWNILFFPFYEYCSQHVKVYKTRRKEHEIRTLAQLNPIYVWSSNDKPHMQLCWFSFTLLLLNTWQPRIDPCLSFEIRCWGLLSWTGLIITSGKGRPWPVCEVSLNCTCLYFARSF